MKLYCTFVRISKREQFVSFMKRDKQLNAKNSFIFEAIKEKNSKHTIVCIDDEQILLQNLAQQLKDCFGSECKIETCDCPLEGLEIIKEIKAEGRHVPVVISDHIMPKMTGDKLLTEIHHLFPETKKFF